MMTRDASQSRLRCVPFLEIGSNDLLDKEVRTEQI